MTSAICGRNVLFCVLTGVLWTYGAWALMEPLGNGYFHHGVATPVSNHRGIVATVDGEGRDVVLVWLFDHRGGYALLMLDAETGKSEQIPMPFPPGGDCPYASLLSSRNKFYTHFNSNFVEFDPAQRAFTFFGPTAPQMAMSMTEDDNGLIWAVTYPSSGVMSFDPASKTLKDYGHVYSQNWNQYPRYVAADDKGWIYFGVGTTSSQIIIFNPSSGEAKPLIPEAERLRGSGYVCRYTNGKVYGHAGSGAKDAWYALYEGTASKCGEPEGLEKKPIIADSQGLFHRDFPDGSRLQSCDLVNRVFVVQEAGTGGFKTVNFDYTSEGAHIMGVIVAPDGTVCGGTAFPMRFFSYNPKMDTWTNYESYGQWNTVARQGERIFVGGYGGGFLLEWNPFAAWTPTEKGRPESNPLFLTECTPSIHRPHELLAHPDGRTLVLAGTPGYGYTGGGLLFWDRKTGTRTLVEHTAILPEQATTSLAALPGGKLIGGTTTSPGTGGEKKAREAELYLLDLESKQVEWHEALFPGAQEYTDLSVLSGELVGGIVDTSRFFVFDAAQRKVIHEEDTASRFGPSCHHQGPRVFVTGPGNTFYLLFRKGVAHLDPLTYAITMPVESPVSIGTGGDFLDGRIYFGSDSHLYSYKIEGA